MRKLIFWTKEEDALLEKAHSNSSTQLEAINSLKGKINRTPASIQVRMNAKFGKKRAPKLPSNAISLPKGFSFDLKPERIVMYKDKLEIYF